MSSQDKPLKRRIARVLDTGRRLRRLERTRPADPFARFAELEALLMEAMAHTSAALEAWQTLAGKRRGH